MRLVLGVALLAVPAVAIAQQPADSLSNPLPDGSSGTSAPSAPPARSGNGMVVVPPVTDPHAIAEPPRNVDPEIDDLTEQWDRKDRARKPQETHGKGNNTIRQEHAKKALPKKE